MPFVAIIGAGPIGGALAHALAGRGRIGEVRLIDTAGKVAAGKALDILQAAPIELSSTSLTSADSFTAAAGARAIVLADLVDGGEIAGEAGVAVLRQLERMGADAPLLFACGGQHQLMTRAVQELHLPRRRVTGSAPLALESGVRAVVAALTDASPVDLSIAVAGVPPRDAVIGWEAATAFGQPIARVLPPHQMAAVSARLPALWPPAPYALASAAARVAEALANGTRRRYTCFAPIDAIGAGRNIIAAVPVEFVEGGIGKTLEPALSRRERTLFENCLR